MAPHTTSCHCSAWQANAADALAKWTTPEWWFTGKMQRLLLPTLLLMLLVDCSWCWCYWSWYSWYCSCWSCSCYWFWCCWRYECWCNWCCSTVALSFDMLRLLFLRPLRLAVFASAICYRCCGYRPTVRCRRCCGGCSCICACCCCYCCVYKAALILWRRDAVCQSLRGRLLRLQNACFAQCVPT